MVYDGRAVHGSRTTLYSAFMTLCGVSLLVAAHASDFHGFLLAVVIFGIGNSSMVSQRASVMGDILEPNQLASAIGVGNLFKGIDLLTGTSTAGTHLPYRLYYYALMTYFHDLFVIVFVLFFVLCQNLYMIGPPTTVHRTMFLLLWWFLGDS